MPSSPMWSFWTDCPWSNILDFELTLTLKKNFFKKPVCIYTFVYVLINQNSNDFCYLIVIFNWFHFFHEQVSLVRQMGRRMFITITITTTTATTTINDDDTLSPLASSSSSSWFLLFCSLLLCSFIAILFQPRDESVPHAQINDDQRT